MITYQATSWDGRTEIFAALTYSDAYEKAVRWAGDDGLKDFYESR